MSASEGQTPGARDMKNTEKGLRNRGDKKLAPDVQTASWKHEGSSGGWQSWSYSGSNLCGYDGLSRPSQTESAKLEDPASLSLFLLPSLSSFFPSFLGKWKRCIM